MSYRHLLHARLAVVAVISTVASLGAAAAPAAEPRFFSAVAGGISGSYIVTLKPVAGNAALSTVTDALAAQYGATVTQRYSNVLQGFAARVPEERARRLAADSRVARVEQDATERVDDLNEDDYSTAADQANPGWALDRIDQRLPSLDDTYRYPDAGRGAGKKLWILDTGVNRQHEAFAGVSVTSFADYKPDPTVGFGGDCNGHGTAVASMAGGGLYGVAREAWILNVKTHDCEGKSETTTLVAALDLVRLHGTAWDVVNLSTTLQGSPTAVQALEELVANGITVVRAAGNDNTYICDNAGMNVPGVIVVGASEYDPLAAEPDRRWTDSDPAKGSNYGHCLNLFAPGDGVRGAVHDADSGYELWTGTSMAAPLTAGAVVALKDRFPTATPIELAARLGKESTRQIIQDARSSDSEHLLHVGEPYIQDLDVTLADNGFVWSPTLFAWGQADDTVYRHVFIHIDLDHPRPGDLEITLDPPGFTSSVIIEPVGGNAGQTGIHREYMVNLSSVPMPGSWKLGIRDTNAGPDGSPGVLTRWSLLV